MKFFHIDWNQIFDLLPLWDAMQPESRRVFLNPKLSHTQTVPGKDYGPDLRRMTAAGLVEEAKPGTFRPAKPKGVLFRRIFMQFFKQPIFESSAGRDELDRYLTKHFLSEDVMSLHPRWNEPRISIGTEEWHRSFIETDDLEAWERPKRGRDPEAPRPRGWIYGIEEKKDPGPKTFLTTPAIAEATRFLVRLAHQSPEPLPLSLLRKPVRPEISRNDQALALLAAIRYALLFPGLLPESLEAVFWIWPPAGRRLHRPPDPAPKTVKAEEIPSHPFLLEDCSILLARASAEPLPTKKGFSFELYRKSQMELEAQLPPAPDLPGISQSQRLGNALRLLMGLSFLKQHQGAKYVLKATSAGVDWLKLPAEDRLRVILDTYRKRTDSVRKRSYSFMPDVMSFSPASLSFKDDGYPAELPLTSWLEELWGTVPDGAFYGLEEWTRFHARNSPPADLAPSDLIGYDIFHFEGVFEEVGEEMLHEILQRFFFERLLPLGCVRLGRNKDGALCFGLNPTGRYFVAGTGSVTLPQANEEAGVLVKPDFEIVFLGPNPLAQAELSAQAELCGKAPGVMFRITKTATLRAVEIGRTADQILETFDRLSSKPIPANVRAQITDWTAGCREIEQRKVILLTCPDEVVAGRVAEFLGSECERLTPRILALPPKSIDTAILRRLKREGIFVR